MEGLWSASFLSTHHGVVGSVARTKPAGTGPPQRLPYLRAWLGSSTNQVLAGLHLAVAPGCPTARLLGAAVYLSVR